ncbi:hypothetical protein Tco_1293089 [Tanacetum coccineum]
MAAFRVLKTQYQKFINSRFSLDDDDGLMTSKYFLEYTRIETKKGKVDMSKPLDSSLVITERSKTKFKEQNTSSSSMNDADADDADIKPVYDEEPLAEVQLTAKCNVFAIGQQHTEQPEFNNEGGVDQDSEQCYEKCPLPSKLTNHKITKLLNQSLKYENIYLKRLLPNFKNGSTLYCS